MVQLLESKNFSPTDELRSEIIIDYKNKNAHFSKHPSMKNSLRKPNVAKEKNP